MSRLEVQVAAMPSILDGLVTENFEQWTVIYNVADRIVEYGGKNELQTNLAKSYKVSADGKEYLFQLAQGRLFHNGDPVTVEDVIYSLGLSLRNAHSYSNLKDQVACTPGSNEDGCGGIVRVSSTEFRVKLRQSSSTFLDKLNMNENAIRSKKANLAGQIVYSGPYKIAKAALDKIELEINDRHPKSKEESFKTISVSRLPDGVPNIQKRLADKNQPVVMISKGFPTMLSKGSQISSASAYQYASGNSYILALRPDVPHLDQYKHLIQHAVLTNGALADFPYLKPLSAIYPSGYALATPVLLPSKQSSAKMPNTLRVKYPASSLGSDLVVHLTKLMLNASVKFELVPVDASVYKAPLLGSDFDGMIAFPFIDIQDEVRVARGYFTGYWNYFPSPKADLLSVLSEADESSNPDERTAKMRHFYQKLITEYPIVPLFFTPSMILLSDDIDRRPLEFYGNTIKFELFSRRPPT